MLDAEPIQLPVESGRGAVSETLRVPPSLLTSLLKIAPARMRRKVPRGHALYRQGEVSNQLFVVISGRIGMSMLRSGGQELLIDIVGAGALCGEGAAFDGLPRFSSAQALEPSEVLAISMPELFRLMAECPELTAMFVRTIALKQRTLANRLLQVTQAPEVRITELMSQISRPGAPGVSLTHQQIASLIGASRITVTRAMQKLRREGTVRCKRGRYELVRGARCA